MTQTLGPTTTTFPDHTQLPETDGIPVKNFQEHPQSLLLTDSFDEVLERLHPNGQYAIGQDCGIYWRYDAEDPLRGCVAPDWFYVPEVPPTFEGKSRRSYVMWKELVAPTIAIELASEDGTEERDVTPPKDGEKPGKFWVYERILKVPYYGIYVIDTGKLEVYQFQTLEYQQLSPDAYGRYALEPLGVALGVWHGFYKNQELDWLRWWDLDGRMLPIGKEEAELERDRAEQEKQRADRAEEKSARLAERLRALGIDPDEV